MKNLARNSIYLGLWLRSSLIVFEPMRARNQRKAMFTRVKLSAKEEIHRGEYTSVVQTGKDNKGKNDYAARRSRKP